MSSKKNANNQLKAEEEKWEKSCLITREKTMITETVHAMDNVPSVNELDPERLRSLALNVCLQLKSRSPRWERFLTKKGNLKATKFLKLEAYLLEILKKHPVMNESTPG